MIRDLEFCWDIWPFFVAFILALLFFQFQIVGGGFGRQTLATTRRYAKRSALTPDNSFYFPILVNSISAAHPWAVQAGNCSKSSALGDAPVRHSDSDLLE